MEEIKLYVIQYSDLPETLLQKGITEGTPVRCTCGSPGDFVLVNENDEAPGEYPVFYNTHMKQWECWDCWLK